MNNIAESQHVLWSYFNSNKNNTWIYVYVCLCDIIPYFINKKISSTIFRDELANFVLFESTILYLLT